MKIIDGHMHIEQWLRSDGSRAFDVVDEYCRNNGIAYVDNMCCTNNYDLWPGFELDQSILGAIVKLENPRVFVHGCLYIPGDGDKLREYGFVSQAEDLMELGLDGVKICDFKPDAYRALNVERHLDEYEKYLTACEKYKVHMCWHVADPDFFWDEEKIPEEVKSLNWFYGNGDFPSYEKLISYACELINRHPNLHVQLAHAFFKSNEPDEVEALLKNHPHVHIDLAPGGEMFEGFRAHYDRWRDIFRTYSDRFVFATDTSTTYSSEDMTDLAGRVLKFLQTDEEFRFSRYYNAHGIALEGEQLENVLYKNHGREVGTEPRQINRAALKKHIARFLPLLKDTENKQMIEDYYRRNLL